MGFEMNIHKSDDRCRRGAIPGENGGGSMTEINNNNNTKLS